MASRSFTNWDGLANQLYESGSLKVTALGLETREFMSNFSLLIFPGLSSRVMLV